MDDELETRPRTHWLEPVPDAHVLPTDVDPAELVVLRETIRLAFVAAMQHLPPKQRAVLLLTEVLGWSAAEVADTLDSTVPAVNSALQRARDKLATRDVKAQPASLSGGQSQTVAGYVAAFERYDVDGLVSMLTDDAVLSMPPYTLWLRGPAAIATWLRGPGSGCRGSRLVATAACGAPAFAQYRDGGRTPWALMVLELSGDRISGLTSFLDVDVVFPRFEMPARLPG